MKKLIIATLIILTLTQIFTGCNSCSKERHPVSNGTSNKVKQEIKISKAIFFIENSGSMFGYVKQANEFISTLVGLSYMPVFDNVHKSFYFINGKNPNICTEYIGNDPECLKNKLNVTSFHEGNIQNSDLNKMFETALDSAKNNNISAIISDCIYDVGNEINPLTALKIETQKTQQIFRERIEKDNVETVIIKAYSKFTGDYCFGSKNGSVNINQTRPFYIIFFGKSAILNKYITDNNLNAKIEGQHEIARFLKMDNQIIPYQAIYTPSNKGFFKPDYSDNTKLLKAEADRHGAGFQFSIAVDFSSLPFSDSYLNSLNNYKSNLSYSILKIETVKMKIKEVTIFVPTHIITVYTSKNPCGNLEIDLKNVMPSWITKSNIDSENQIDSSHTFGFKSLINAISEGYYTLDKDKNITSLKFDIK
jgi:hypothetical protein